jgi:hypothetical protein
LAIDQTCQPLLGGEDCLLPYPSDFFLVQDNNFPSGHRIEVQGDAKMLDIEGESANVFDFRPADGFSRIPSLAFVLPEGPVLDNAPGLLSHEGVAPKPADQTLIIDATTFELVAHYSDLDPEFEDPTQQAVMMRVRGMLKAEHRYVVAVHSLNNREGQRIATPEGFRRLRDAVNDESLASMQARFDLEIFSVTTKVGLARADLQLAWDFTTGSVKYLKRDLYSIRDQTMDWLSKNTPKISIKSVLEDSDNRIETIVRGQITAPLFLDEDKAGGRLLYDDEGKITTTTTTQFDFLARIPKSVLTSSTPGGAIGFGHGLFGTRNEGQSGVASDMAARTHSVLFALDWVGMSRGDVLLITDDLISHPYRILRFADRAHQAMANWMVMSHVAKNGMRALSEFHRPGTNTPVYAVDRFNFLGISMGHILAGTLAALDPLIERVCLNVGGAGFSHIISRSNAFAPFMLLMDTPLPSPLDRQKFIATLQTQFDRIDAATYADDLRQNSDKRVLMQIALGDTTVPNLGSFLHARLLDLKLMTPSAYELPGLSPQSDPTTESTLALYDFGVDLSIYEPATANLPKTRGHDHLRGLMPAVGQMARFFKDGVIAHRCDGPCDPD